MGLLSSDWGLTLKNLFLPIFCKQCGMRLLTEDNRYFCPMCWGQSPRIEPPHCDCCGKPHPAVLNFGPIRNFPCAECRAASPRTVRYRRILGAAYYQDAIAEAIKLFKFHERVRLAGPLSEIMGEAAERELPCDAYDMIVPVPLYRVRQRARGYNQSALLAHELMARFPNAAFSEGLKRIRPTRTQSRLHSEAERRANVRGAFAVVDGGVFKKTRVLLVDDVVTSGGTVNECAAVLRRAGAAHVDVLAAALAVRKLPEA